MHGAFDSRLDFGIVSAFRAVANALSLRARTRAAFRSAKSGLECAHAPGAQNLSDLEPAVQVLRRRTERSGAAQIDRPRAASAGASARTMKPVALVPSADRPSPLVEVARSAFSPAASMPKSVRAFYKTSDRSATVSVRRSCAVLEHP